MHGEWVDGVVTEWESNTEYWMDSEKTITVEELSKTRPSIVEEFRPFMIDGDTIVYVRTAPESWDNFCGREGYAIVWSVTPYTVWPSATHFFFPSSTSRMA
jgi:hypothetical protein